MTLKISAFKKEEIVVLTPVNPFSSNEIKEIIKYYFPNFQIDNRIAERWSGRGRFIMQYFIESIFKKSIALNSNKFEEIINIQEPKWYESSISLMLTYFQSYQELEIMSGKYQHEKKVREILEYIYHDCIMRRKGKQQMLTYEEAANLIQQGIMFLPSTFKEKDFEIQMFQEPISFDALGQYFQMKRENKNNILEDPILKLCYNELKQEPEGSGYIWEDCFTRFIMLNLQPKLGKRESIQNSSLMKDFIEIDPTLIFYTLEALYITDEEYSKQDFISYLNSGNTTSIYFPDNFAGPDTVIPLAKMTFDECQNIDQKLAKKKFNSLPNIRMLVIQDKYLTSGQALSDSNHAIDTCNLYECYTQKNKEKKEHRQKYEEFLKTSKGKEIVNWSIGILCVAGNVPKDLDQKIKVYSGGHHLFGCITPLSFNFESDLQNLLLYSCKLSDKDLGNQVRQFYDEKKYNEIVKLNFFEPLSVYHLRTIEAELSGKKRSNKGKRDDVIQRIKKIKIDEKLIDQEIDEELSE